MAYFFNPTEPDFAQILMSTALHINITVKTISFKKYFAYADDTLVPDVHLKGEYQAFVMHGIYL